MNYYIRDNDGNLHPVAEAEFNRLAVILQVDFASSVWSVSYTAPTSLTGTDAFLTLSRK